MIDDYIEQQIAIKGLVAKLEKATLRNDYESSFDSLAEMEREISRMKSWLWKNME